MHKLILLSLACALLAAGCNSTIESEDDSMIDIEPGVQVLKLNWRYGAPKYRMTGYTTFLGNLYMKLDNVHTFY